MSGGTAQPGKHPLVEEVEIAGHIIDSLILPKVLDEIAALGGRHQILEIKIGENRKDPSFARMRVEADSTDAAAWLELGTTYLQRAADYHQHKKPMAVDTVWAHATLDSAQSAFEHAARFSAGPACPIGSRRSAAAGCSA